MRERAQRVGLQHAPQAVDGIRIQRTGAVDRGVVHERVELAGRREAGRDGGVVGDVEREHPPALEVGQQLRVAGGGDDVVSAGDQLLRRRPTDGAPGAGDEDAHRGSVRRSAVPSQNHDRRIAICPPRSCEHSRMDKGTILVVEDEPNIADLVDLYLSRDGYRVLKQPTGKGGLDAIRDHRPRLVVLDVGLPDIDGLEICRQIRATSSVPVIFLTARAEEVDRVLGLELGADDYLTKPFGPAELVARVKAVLRRTDGAQTAEIVPAGTGGRRRRPSGDPRRRRAGRVHHQGVRAPAVPRRAPGSRPEPAADPRRRLGSRLVRRRAHRGRPHRAGPQEARGCVHDRHRARPRLPARAG